LTHLLVGHPFCRSVRPSHSRPGQWRGGALSGALQHVGKKAPTLREEMNYQPKGLSIMTISKSVPTGSGELTPDKPIKKGERRNKTSGLEGHDGGTVDEAGTSNPSGMRGCQSAGTHLWSSRIYPPQQGCWPSSSRLRGFPLSRSGRSFRRMASAMSVCYRLERPRESNCWSHGELLCL